MLRRNGIYGIGLILFCTAIMVYAACPCSTMDRDQCAAQGESSCPVTTNYTRCQMGLSIIKTSAYLYKGSQAGFYVDDLGQIHCATSEVCELVIDPATGKKSCVPNPLTTQPFGTTAELYGVTDDCPNP